MTNIIVDEAPLPELPSVIDVEPVGFQVLFEELTAQELQSSKIYVAGKRSDGPPQGYILKVGPKVDVEEWGFKVGDRVVLVGNYTPVPGDDGRERALGMVEPHQIKAVLVEND
jgi:co-chaperonin GroES (HSP10)